MTNLEFFRKMKRGKLAQWLIQRHNDGVFVTPDGVQFRWNDGSHKSKSHAWHEAVVHTAAFLKEENWERSERRKYRRTDANLIYVNARDDETMENLGFVQCDSGEWYYCEELTDGGPVITFNLTVGDNAEACDLRLIDEQRGEPFRPGRRSAKTDRDVMSGFRREMETMVAAGIVLGYDYGDYI